MVNGLLKYLNPKLLRLWVRSLNGGPMPTADELASIGGYRLDAVVAYLKLARRLRSAPPTVPNVAYSGHTGAPASRRRDHYKAALRLVPGTGFRDLYRANRPHHRFPEIVGTLAVPSPSNEEELRRAVLLAHFAEGIIAYWLGTINDDSILSRVSGRPRSAYGWVGGDSHLSFREGVHALSTRTKYVKTPGRKALLVTDRERVNRQWLARYHAMPSGRKTERLEQMSARDEKARAAKVTKKAAEFKKSGAKGYRESYIETNLVDSLSCL